LTQFRNISLGETQFSDGLNIITGLNGVGKSSLIDAIHCLAFGRSYFSSSDKYIVQHEKEFYRIEGNFNILDDDVKIVCKYQLGKKKSLEVNDKKNARLSDHVGLSPIICIAPKDVSLITQGSEYRRKLIDQTLSQYDKLFLRDLNTYNRLLKQRNAWLKANKGKTMDDTYLLTIDDQMGPLAEAIYQKRRELVREK